MAALATASFSLLGVTAFPTQAQSNTVSLAPPSNVISLSAEASLEVAQDMLTLVLITARDGSDANTVQSQMRQTLEGALAEARKAVRPGQVDVRTGQFSLYPRRNNNGSITGWQGQAELILEGRDLQALSQLAGRLNGMTVSRVAFGLSKEAREKVHGEIAAEAIARFKQRAQAYAQAFGFGGFSVREVNVSGGETMPHPAQPMMLRAAGMAKDAAESQPIEAGKATLSVSVSGSVQMSPR